LSKIDTPYCTVNKQPFYDVSFKHNHPLYNVHCTMHPMYNASLVRCIPCKMRPLYDVSLIRYVPCTILALYAASLVPCVPRLVCPWDDDSLGWCVSKTLHPLRDIWLIFSSTVHSVLDIQGNSSRFFNHFYAALNEPDQELSEFKLGETEWPSRKRRSFCHKTARDSRSLRHITLKMLLSRDALS
jgi:hypothetical protein